MRGRGLENFNGGERMTTNTEKPTQWIYNTPPVDAGRGFSEYALVTVENTETGRRFVQQDRYDCHSNAWEESPDIDGSNMIVRCWMPLPEAG